MLEANDAIFSLYIYYKRSLSCKEPPRSIVDRKQAWRSKIAGHHVSSKTFTHPKRSNNPNALNCMSPGAECILRLGVRRCIIIVSFTFVCIIIGRVFIVYYAFICPFGRKEVQLSEGEREFHELFSRVLLQTQGIGCAQIEERKKATTVSELISKDNFQYHN